MSKWTRMASTDAQEESIKTIESWMKSAGITTNRGEPGFAGGTTIGKHPQTVILDLHHQGSDFYVDRDGQIELDDKELRTLSDFKKQISISSKKFGCKPGEFFKHNKCKKIKG